MFLCVVTVGGSLLNGLLNWRREMNFKYSSDDDNANKEIEYMTRK